MDERKTSQGVAASLQEPAELENMADQINELLERDMAPEAVARFFRLRPADQADVLALLARETQAQLLSWFTPRNLGVIIEELEAADAVELSQGLEPRELSKMLDSIGPDIAADILRGLPDDVATRTLENMLEADSVVPLLEYEDDDAGGLMTPEFLAVRDDMSVSQALAFVRRWSQDLDPEDVSHLFVVDRDNVFKGRTSLARLVLARPYQNISLVMQSDDIAVAPETDQEQCARLMQRYNLGTLPVVDEDRRLVGVLRLEDMIEVVDDEATEDMYRMIGVGQQEKAVGPFWSSVRGRLPWLCVNLATAVLAGGVVTVFQSTIAQAVTLAAFLPVIAGQGGIAGTQTLTLIVRSLALGEISPGSGRRLLAKEAGLGLVHGLALGALVGVIALVWKGSEYLALVVAVAMLSNLVIAGISGVLVPMGLRAMRIDPALASAVAVTTITDVLGFTIYLGLAALTIGLIMGSL